MMSSGELVHGQLYYNPESEVWWRWDETEQRWIRAWAEEAEY